jgi:pyruvate dehydrogenase E2 component (dihydrolipoamide acetyltransferase)
MIKEVLVPDIGDFKNVAIIEILVKAGDTIKKEDSLIALESDKATMEIPAPFGGTVKDLKVKVGDKVSEGMLVLTMEAEGSNGAAKPSPAPMIALEGTPAKAAAPAPVASAPTPVSSSSNPQVLNETIDEAGFSKAHASPAARLYARELGVDLIKVKGTGPNERITREDIQSYVKAALAGGGAANVGGGAGLNLLPMPNVDFAKFGAVEAKPLSRIKKISGANLHRNWVMIPHITQNDEADITDLEAFRKAMAEEAKAQGVKLTLLAFLMKASVAALKRNPEFNASLDASGENLILKKYYNIGVAVDTPDGLVVPVIRNVDQKSIFDLARELGEVSTRARDKKLGPAEMQGGCFTISSLGGIGGTAFTPIINAPEVAILGVSKSSVKPVYQNNQFVPRLMLPLSLSYDHRVIDGASGARFVSYLSAVLSDIRRVLL